MRRLASAVGAVTLAIAAATVGAQTQPPTPPEDNPGSGPVPPALSKECQTPGVTISGDVQLPNVTRALRLRKTIRILAIGASSKGGSKIAVTATKSKQRLLCALGRHFFAPWVLACRTEFLSAPRLLLADTKANAQVQPRSVRNKF